MLALRAAGLEVGDPGQLLRTCTTVFAGQVAAGPLDIHVSVLRRGRSATQVQAAVRNEGAEAGASVVAGSARRAGVLRSSTSCPPKCRHHWRAPPTENHRHLGSSRLSRFRSGRASRGALPLATRHGSNTSPPDPTWPHGCGSTALRSWRTVRDRPSRCSPPWRTGCPDASPSGHNVVVDLLNGVACRPPITVNG